MKDIQNIMVHAFRYGHEAARTMLSQKRVLVWSSCRLRIPRPISVSPIRDGDSESCHRLRLIAEDNILV